MPLPSSKAFNPVEHLKQAEENEQLARALIALDSCYKDWVVTLTFYSAMHYVYSKLPGPKVPTTHTAADSVISAEFGNPIYLHYNVLKDRSRNSRYYPTIAAEYRRKPSISEKSLKILDSIKTELGIS